jgi:GNAT superfamily N-acetyltransferase
VTPRFTLRDARPEDCADIARLVRDLAAFEKLADQARGTEEGFRAQLFGDRPNAYAIVAELGGSIVGLALWFHNFSTFACGPGLYVEDVFVEPAHRGLGIGRAFFRAMARRAVDRGCSRMEWSVLDWNESAVRFYRGMGAVGMSDWTVQRLSAAPLAALAQEA